MDAKLIEVFHWQIKFQCDCALKSAGDLDDALRARNTMTAFYAIQSLLVAAANLSKALWDGQNPGARTPLRASLQILDTSPLHPRDMRNHYEHFDERLDKWYRESKTHAYIDLNIGTIVDKADNIDMFRGFDPQTHGLSFWGDQFNIKQLIDEINGLRARVNKLLRLGV